MKFFEENNNILIGLVIGAIVPVIGYALVEFIFQLLTDSGIMDEVNSYTENKRKRTLALIALCFNIISVQFFKSRRFNKIINGIVTATMIYAIFWVLVFKIL